MAVLRGYQARDAAFLRAADELVMKRRLPPDIVAVIHDSQILRM
jgi:hypothetical protein